MRNKMQIAIAALCAALSLSVHADLSGTFKTIALDGSLDDWSNPADVLYDGAEIGVGTPANSTYEVVYLANDVSYLYIGLDTAGTGGGSISNTWTRNIYLDMDMDAGTGFNAGWMGHGYDHLIQYGASGTSYSVYEFTGATQADWSWNFLGLVSYAYSNDVAEIAVPLSNLGAVAGDPFVMELNVSGSNVTTETWAHSDEPSAETYFSAVFTSDYPAIVVDGSLGEWNNPGDVLYNDSEILDGSPTNSSYENVYVANDASKLYLGLDTKGVGGGSITNTWTRNVYLDTDLDGGTGFNGGWMGHGYDRLIQYGAGGGAYSVYEFAGAAQSDWTWNFLGEITYSYSNDVVEMSVPLTSLGLAPGDSVVVELNVSGTGVSTETWASEFESGAKTYVLLDNGSLVPIGTIALAGPVSGGQAMVLSWNSDAGQSYTVEYKNSLPSDPAWLAYTNLVSPASGGIAVTTTVSQASTFYRVVSP